MLAWLRGFAFDYTQLEAIGKFVKEAYSFLYSVS